MLLFPGQLRAAYLLLIGFFGHQPLEIPDHWLFLSCGHLVQEIVPFNWHQDRLAFGVVLGSLFFLGHDGILLALVYWPQLQSLQTFTNGNTYFLRNATSILADSLFQLLPQQWVKSHLETLVAVPVFIFAALCHVGIMSCNNHHVYPHLTTRYIQDKDN